MALNVAHWGALALASEKTMAAIEKAAELGADATGLDLSLSRDSELGVMHDDTLNRGWQSGSQPVRLLRLSLEARDLHRLPMPSSTTPLLSKLRSNTRATDHARRGKSASFNPIA